MNTEIKKAEETLWIALAKAWPEGKESYLIFEAIKDLVDAKVAFAIKDYSDKINERGRYYQDDRD